MKKKKILASALATVLATSVVLTGCGSKGNGDKKETNNKSESKDKEEVKMDKDQYINMLLGSEPKTLDLGKSTDTLSSLVLGNTMEALTRVDVDKDGKDVLCPGAAESWKQSKDGLKWTFKIREMNWSDGSKVEVDDFIYSMLRTLNPETGSQYSLLLYPIKNAKEYNTGKAKADDVGIKKIDDNTLEFELSTPCSYFLQLTHFKVMQPLKKETIEKHGDKYGTEANTMLYCGPFKISKWEHDHVIEFEKNPEYWDKDAVKLDKATLKVIKEENSRMSELQNGSIDFCAVSKPEWIKKFDETKKFWVRKGYDGSSWHMAYNFNDKYFKNAKIRKAFTLAVDRKGICETIYKGLAEPATAWCPPGVQINDKDFREQYKFDYVEELKKENGNKTPKELLIEGLKEENLDPDPSKHTFKYLQEGATAWSKGFGDFVQQNFKKELGVDVQIEYVEFAIFQKRTNELDFQFATKGWQGDYDDPNTFFDLWMSTVNMSPTGWENKKYDDLIIKAGKLTDNKERMKLFEEAEKLLLVDDSVIGPTVYRFRNTYIRNYVKDFVSPTWGELDLKKTYTSGRE